MQLHLEGEYLILLLVKYTEYLAVALAEII